MVCCSLASCICSCLIVTTDDGKAVSPHRVMGGAGPELALQMQMEAAKLLWAQGQQATAARMARSLEQGSQSGIDPDTHVRLKCLTAKWLAETR
jgi:hypothetical protein